MVFLHRLRVATRNAFRVAAEPRERSSALQSDDIGLGVPALLSRLVAPDAELVRADATWKPDTPALRIEVMASGSFESLRGVQAAANRLQSNLVSAIREGTLEIRLTEVRRTCRHVTAWSRSPVDPGAATTEWECLVDALFEDAGRRRTLLAQAFRDSIHNRVNHLVLFGDSFDDGLFSLNAAVRNFRQRGIRVSTFYLGTDFNGRNMYRFLAASTGGLYLPLPGHRNFDSVLPIVAAFACGDRARLAALPSATPEAKALIAQARRR